VQIAAAVSVLAAMDATHLLFARIYQPVIESEVLRQDIFAGRRSPLIRRTGGVDELAAGGKPGAGRRSAPPKS
jgi:protein involved in temperature-dependent protein secretion